VLQPLRETDESDGSAIFSANLVKLCFFPTRALLFYELCCASLRIILFGLKQDEEIVWACVGRTIPLPHMLAH
jgi:hypothetical protein